MLNTFLDSDDWREEIITHGSAIISKFILDLKEGFKIEVEGPFHIVWYWQVLDTLGDVVVKGSSSWSSKDAKTQALEAAKKHNLLS